MNHERRLSGKSATNLRDWIDQLPSGFLRVSSAGVILYENTSAKLLLGARIRDVGLFDLLAFDGVPSWQALINELCLVPPSLLHIPVRLRHRTGATANSLAPSITADLSLDPQSGEVTVLLDSSWSQPWAGWALCKAAQAAGPALQAVLEECAAIAGTRTAAHSAFLLSLPEGEITVHASWHRMGPSSTLPSPQALIAVAQALQKASPRRIHTPTTRVIAVPLSFAGHGSSSGSAAILIEGGPCGLNDLNLLGALSCALAPLWGLLASNQELNAAYEELLQEVRAMPDLNLMLDAIHDAKNYVRDSIGSVESIQDDLRRDLMSDQAATLVNSIASLRQSRDLLADMLKDWSAPSVLPAPQRAKTVDLVEVTHRVESLMKGAAGSTISFLHKTHNKRAVLVFGSKSQILVLVYHLVSNAVKALKTQQRGGIISISLRQRPGVAVRSIEIADNGPGFPTPLRDQFNRRQPLPGGAGRGLAQVRAIVETLGGKITLDSTPGAGARFKIELNGPI